MDDTCPRCKTSKYRNPSLKLLTNVCGHALCDSCVELLFLKGSGSCPECGVTLRRSGFRLQLFEDPVVEKEVEIRRRVLKDFNKRESDFLTLREYNDYLEQIEEIVFNLVNDLDILETNKKIEQYKKENKEQITKSRLRPNPQLEELEVIMENERIQSENRRFQTANMEKEEKLQKLKTREALIDDLMFSESDAKSIVALHKTAIATAAASLAATNGNSNVSNGASSITTSSIAASSRNIGVATSVGVRVGAGTSFLPVPKSEDIPLYKYVELHLDLGGLEAPTDEQIKTRDPDYLAHVKEASVAELAGGFHSSIACRRALQDAFSDLAFQPTVYNEQEQQF